MNIKSKNTLLNGDRVQMWLDWITLNIGKRNTWYNYINVLLVRQLTIIVDSTYICSAGGTLIISRNGGLSRYEVRNGVMKEETFETVDD